MSEARDTLPAPDHPTTQARLRVLRQLLAVRFSPDPPDDLIYRFVQEQLRRDAFLRYIGETDLQYHIETANGLKLTVPKMRAVPAAYPPLQRSPLYPAGRCLLAACVGLLPAGIGALFCAPLAALLALKAARRPLLPADRIRLRLLLIGAFFIWCLAAALAALLLLHIGVI